MKKCFRCQKLKVDSEYYSNKSWCKQCHSEYYKSKTYSKRGKDKQVRDDLPNGNRVCNSCKKEMLLEAFPKNKKCTSGCERKCKRCTYRARDSKRPKMREQQMEWYQNNKDRILEMRKEYYKENRERIKTYSRQYHKDNPEVARAAFHRRRAHIQNNGRNNLTSTQIKWMFDSFPYCIYCGIEEGLTIDHIIPISKGGENTLDNIVPACLPCNNEKRAKEVEVENPVKSATK